MQEIRVYHAFRSPYSRLGLHIIERAKLAVRLIPFTGPPEGVAFQDPVANPAKLAYYLQDAPRMARRMGLRIRPPQPFEVDFKAANRAAIAAARDGFGLSFALAAADARWGAGADVSDFSVLEKCAADCGWRADAVRNAQTDRAVTDEIKAHRALIEEDQAFGVPFAVFGDNKYWGHERFDILVEDVAQAKA